MEYRYKKMIKYWQLKCWICGHRYEVKDHSGDKAIERCPKCGRGTIGVN
ncbi:hypothetical protein LCGC14_0355840 [marine sediment metagenome]|uniref:Rubredoxin-like domain-containing protein n=1 Tax=marine sediment metagenome TaxID=412755 RepID=A0A0F9TSC5_9ZZZZ